MASEPGNARMPSISVIIPTCHRNDLLAVCLDRLAPGAQSLSPEQYEVVVTDDGINSTAKAMLRDRYAWARWVQGPRRGPAANRNSGARIASGELIAFTDDDCIPSPNWLMAYSAAIQPELDVYEGKTTCTPEFRSPLDRAPLNLNGGCFWSCNLMVRAASFQKLGGFDEDFPTAWCEDVEFFHRVKQTGTAWRFVSEAIVDHPTRRQALGIAAGRLWASHVLLWYKAGNRLPAWRWLPLLLLKNRIREITQFPFSRDSVIAFGSMWIEFGYALFRLPEWERKYRPFVNAPRNHEEGE